MRKSSTFFADIQIKNTAHALTTEEVAALEILRGTGVNIVEAALVARKGRRARTQSDYRYWIDKLRVTIDPPPLKLRRGEPVHRRATLCLTGGTQKKSNFEVNGGSDGGGDGRGMGAGGKKAPRGQDLTFSGGREGRYGPEA